LVRLTHTSTELEMNWSIKSHNENHHAIVDVSEDESHVVAEVYSARGTARTMANAEELLVAAIDLVKVYRKVYDTDAYKGIAHIWAIIDLEKQIRISLGSDAEQILGDGHVSSP